MPINNNISVKEYNELNKYEAMEIKIEKMWNLRTTTMPVILVALGMIKKRVR